MPPSQFKTSINNLFFQDSIVEDLAGRCLLTLYKNYVNHVVEFAIFLPLFYDRKIARKICALPTDAHQNHIRFLCGLEEAVIIFLRQ